MQQSGIATRCSGYHAPITRAFLLSRLPGHPRAVNQAWTPDRDPSGMPGDTPGSRKPQKSNRTKQSAESVCDEAGFDCDPADDEMFNSRPTIISLGESCVTRGIKLMTSKA
jgi:hypothetical protein